MYIHQRMNWEFFAVLRGQCAPALPQMGVPAFHSRYLWVFPPQTAHGWIGKGSNTCRVAVFHFSSVPSLLERVCRTRGFLGVSIDAHKARFITKVSDELQPHYERMTERSLLVFERVLLELSLMLLDKIPADRTESKTEYALQKVEAAVAWYAEHMAQQPKLDEVSRAVNMSVRHLRRLFQEVRKENPLTVFTAMRLQRSMELLARTDDKLETIARECGFASSSDFSRVFKQYRGINPDSWRRDNLRSYNDGRTERAD